MYSWEKLVLDGFYENVIHSGADWFTMPVVVAGDYTNSTVRIVKDGYNWSDSGFDKWTLSLNIEIRDLPTLDALTVILVGIFGYPPVYQDVDPSINIIYPHAVTSALQAVAEKVN
jgi:hypothetical protein